MIHYLLVWNHMFFDTWVPLEFGLMFLQNINISAKIMYVQVSKNWLQMSIFVLATISWTEIRVTYCNNNPTRRKKGEKIMIEKNIRRATWTSKIFESKDTDIIFWWYFPPARPKELLREEKGWLTYIGHNSWWHMKCAQHAANNPNAKRCDYPDSPGSGHEITGPTHMVEGGHHLKKAPNPHPHLILKVWQYIKQAWKNSIFYYMETCNSIFLQ